MGYNEFTFEYYNDPKIKDWGEWFKLASQFYFYGYTNKEENGYIKYHILNVGFFRLFLNSKNNNWLETHTQYNKPPNKANFIYISFNEIPAYCFYNNY